uniref:Uncharacterized protein n=1 Tax=Sphaerodactylus townsendi TaxID=933632 RepID=A0ACB8EUD6_9SAUR
MWVVLPSKYCPGKGSHGSTAGLDWLSPYFPLTSPPLLLKKLPVVIMLLDAVILILHWCAEWLDYLLVARLKDPSHLAAKRGMNLAKPLQHVAKPLCNSR